MENRNASGVPFYLASVTLVAGSAAVAAVTRSSPLGMVAFLAGLAAAMIFLVLPSWLEHKAQVLDGLGLALAELQERNYDLEGVRREHRRALARTEEVLEGLADLVRLKEELLEIRQDRQRLQRRLEDWEDSLVAYCDDQFRLLSQPGLSDDYRDAAQRSLKHVTRSLQALGLDVLHPETGDPFHDRLHQAIATEPGPAPEGHVLHCRRLGVRRGELVLRRAEVILATTPQEVSA